MGAGPSSLTRTRVVPARVRVKLLGPAPIADSDQIELAQAAPAGEDAAQLY